VLCRVLSKVLLKGGAGLCKVRWPKLTDWKGSVHGGAPRLCAEFGSDAEALGRVLSFHGAVAKFGQTLCKVLCGALQRVVQDSVQSEQGVRRVCEVSHRCCAAGCSSAGCCPGCGLARVLRRVLCRLPCKSAVAKFGCGYGGGKVWKGYGVKELLPPLA
jgi:hypothetical protein